MTNQYDRGWIGEVSRPDLNILHHALRMLQTHPMTPQLPERARVTELADALWDESCERSNNE
jgi:hypothetical protein